MASKLKKNNIDKSSSVPEKRMGSSKLEQPKKKKKKKNLSVNELLLTSDKESEDRSPVRKLEIDCINALKTPSKRSYTTRPSSNDFLEAFHLHMSQEREN